MDIKRRTMKCKAKNRKGNACLNEATDETGYCRFHHPKLSTRPPTGSEFEVQVLKILKLLGYTVDRNVKMNGCQVDVYGEIKTGVITLRLMVECKDYGKKRTVGIEDINKFAGVLAVARNNGVVDKGLFVTTHGYTAEAKVNASRAGIDLTTYRELSTQLVDFTGYIEKVKEEFRNAPVSQYYVELSGTQVEDYEGADKTTFYRPIDEFINKRLFEDGLSKIALLGNFGTGKSTFCHKYAHDLAELYDEVDVTRIPVVVSLSDYDSKLHIQQLILNTLQFKYNLNITSTIFWELQRLGRFVFLLDGFDEMAIRVDEDIIRENIREVDKLSEIPENKFLVTCRTHFFRDKIQASVLAKFEQLFIPEWTELELKEYLQKRFGNSWEKQLRKIAGTHNLPELCQTPLFLEMIVEALPKLGDEVKRVELYEVYTNTWIDDQSRRKGARLPSPQRRQFVTELALKMFLEGKTFCHHSEFIALLRQRFDIDDAAQMDYLRSDVQSCTFLTRDSKGNYSFRHRSFMEFFVAQALTEEIRSGKRERLGALLLPLEIRSFLVDLISKDPPIEMLKEWFKEESEQISRDNILSILTRLKVDISDITSGMEPALESETKIVARFLQGDTEAFDLLYLKFKPILTRYVTARVVQKHLVEDIVVDTFLTAWQRKERLGQASSIGPYLLAIAKNKCIDIQRQNQKYIYLDQFSSESDQEELLLGYEMKLPLQISVQEADAEYEERIEIMNRAIAMLSEFEQKIILDFASGKDSGELARELGLSGTTLRVRRHRILQKLRKYMLQIENQ